MPCLWKVSLASFSNYNHGLINNNEWSSTWNLEEYSLIYLYTPFKRLFQQKFELNEQHEDFDFMFYIIQLLKVCVFVDLFYEHLLLKPTFRIVNPKQLLYQARSPVKSCSCINATRGLV